MVDVEDLPALRGRAWRVVRAGRDKSIAYAACDESSGSKTKRVYLHRFLLGLHQQSRPIVDHVDGNGLNNTRANLRIATHAQNAQNRSTAQTKYRGVFRSGSGFIARAGKVYGGAFRNEIEAALAFDRLARSIYGEAAVCNFAAKPTDLFMARFLETV